MDDDFFRRDYDSPHGHDNLFAWTVFILLLIGFALLCWIGSFYVFGHPENPRSYRILTKLKKLDPPRRFELTAAPPGEFLTPQKLYEKFATMPDAELQMENGELIRNYIRNYQDTKKLVPYLIGRFSILSAYELKKNDLFPSGMVALAQASDYPQVLLEHVYTADAQTVSQLQRMLTPGLDIKLEKTLDLSAIIHVEKLDDGRIQITAVPILYGSYALKQGTGTFSLEPPSTLHLESGMPIIKPATLPTSAKTYAAAVSHTPAPTEDQPPPESSPAPAESPVNPELIRVMPPVAVTTPTPSKHGKAATPSPAAVAVATPVPPPPQPVATPPPAVVQETPAPPPAMESTPVPTPPANTLAENVTPIPRPRATPSVAPAAAPSATPEIPAPTPPAAVPDHPNVPLQPFIVAKTTPTLTTATGSWKVFHPGQMPRGRLVRVSDVADMADRGLSGERLYLSGQFTVTASGENRAVLRAKGSILNTINPLEHNPSSSTRILVEFPAGYQPPAEGTTVSRDSMRPFEIRDVQRARDGTINVYVREVTVPE